MNMKKFPALAAILLLTAGTLIIHACQSAKNSSAAKMLKFNLEKGKGYDYEMIMNFDQEIMGQPVQLDMTTYYSMTVDAEENGIKSIRSIFERFRMKTSLMGLNLDVDTDNPPANDTAGNNKDPLSALSRFFGAIKGQVYSMKVNPEGKILEVSGFEKMGEKLAESLDLDEEQKAEMKKNFESQFNAEEMKLNLERVWHIFPVKEVKVGDSWTTESELHGKMPGVYKSTYTVTDIEGDMVSLEEKTRLEPRGGDGPQLKGEVKGTIVVDSRSGLVVNADQEMKLKTATDGGTPLEITGKSKIKGKVRE